MPAVSRRNVIVAVVAAALGFAPVSAAVVLAGGDQDPPKREPVEDQPGPAFVDGVLPEGTPIVGISQPVQHGPFTVYPVGGIGRAPVSNPPTPPANRQDGVARAVNAQSVTDLPASRLVKHPVLPDGYVFAGGGVTIVDYPDDRSEVRNFGATYDDGVHYSIHVFRSDPDELILGVPIETNEPDDGSTVMISLGRVAGRPALLYHRKPGISTAEQQEVWVASGPILTVVSGYVQDFNTLLTAAESLVREDPQ